MTIGRPSGPFAIVVGVVMTCHAASLGAESDIKDLVRWGRVDEVRKRLDRGFDIDSRLGSNRVKGRDDTLLSAAVEATQVEMVKMLIERGADANAASEWVVPPIHRVVVRPNREIFDALVTAGAHADGRNPKGETALWLAIARDQWDVAGWLIERGADPNVINEQGQPMWTAAGRDWRAMERWLDFGGHVDTPDTQGMTLLRWMAKDRGCPLFDRVAGTTGAIDAADTRDGQTALHVATRQNHIEYVRTLIKNGADPNATDRQDRRPLDLITPGPAYFDDVRAILTEAGGSVTETKPPAELTPTDVPSSAPEPIRPPEPRQPHLLDRVPTMSGLTRTLLSLTLAGLAALLAFVTLGRWWPLRDRPEPDDPDRATRPTLDSQALLVRGGGAVVAGAIGLFIAGMISGIDADPSGDGWSRSTSGGIVYDVNARGSLEDLTPSFEPFDPGETHDHLLPHKHQGATGPTRSGAAVRVRATNVTGRPIAQLKATVVASGGINDRQRVTFHGIPVDGTEAITVHFNRFSDTGQDVVRISVATDRITYAD